MAERSPRVYTIAAHRGFADALVAGLIPRHAHADYGLARLTLLLPSRRAIRTLTEAFIRAAGNSGGGGLLLPRMVAVGELDLDEALGPLLDPLGAADIPPAVDPVWRWLRLAEHLRAAEGEAAGQGAALLRRAEGHAQGLDRLLAEDILPERLLADDVIGIVGDCADHWREATRRFLTVQARWSAELAALGQVDPPTRRNLLFYHAAQAWRASPPADPVVAAGITGASPALAQLLRVISELPQGAVVLPDLDLALDDAVWEELGRAGMAPDPVAPPLERGDALAHPQYHLKLLLNRMGVNRGEVRPWHRAGLAAAPPARAQAISSLFLPPGPSASWAELPEAKRRLAGVRLLESANPAEEAQAIALLIRAALEQPEHRVALVTPDRGLAARVSAELQRWNIQADDSAGVPLSHAAAGRLALLLAEVLAEDAAPVPLIGLLSHPLVMAGEGRAAWLEQVRGLDLALRGPRPAPGLAAIALLREVVRQPALAAWWAGAGALLAPLLALSGGGAETSLAAQLDTLIDVAEALCGEALWAGADGRLLASTLEALRAAAQAAGTGLAPRELASVLRDRFDAVAVRPPWGGHPRVAIYGLLEARLARADLVICGGLVEGVWPGRAAPDPLLPPAVLRHLGVPTGEFRIGLAAHDLAGALGAPQVVLSWARRDAAGPVIPSRFVLRVQAMLGETLADKHREVAVGEWQRALNTVPLADAHPQPRPRPSAAQRRVAISATALDRLRSDPYQFYASAILGLRRLDALDAPPSPALKGTAVHEALRRWHGEGYPPHRLQVLTEEELDRLSAHPLMRALWRPRLVAALGWAEERVAELRAEGRVPVLAEAKGSIDWRGVTIHGRADRIDRLADGALAIIDYKTGAPPSGRMVQEGYALQLGTLGLIAREGGFAARGVAGEPVRFEYWSLSRDTKKDAFGYVSEPVLEGQKKTGLPRDRFLDQTAEFLDEALDNWILGDQPFTARLNPELGSYADYDQLMRLDEWFWRQDKAEEAP
ncbi:MAG: double-strand break repair protein AddB [Proteobacteria bacterium]|nr:double-strand break repair protein AddB [Pseudomonadota bacterium]